MPHEMPTTDTAPTAPSMRSADTAPPPPSTDPQIPGAIETSITQLRTRMEEHIVTVGEYHLREERHREETDKALGAIAVNALKTNAATGEYLAAVTGAMTMASEALAAVKVMASSRTFTDPPPPQPVIPTWAVVSLVGTLGGILAVLMYIAAVTH